MARIVVALGGNALQQNNKNSAEEQKKVAATTARQLAELVQGGHDLIITHGNGPQVGTILLNEEATTSGVPSPLDTCSAMSQGEIGYWLQQSLINALREKHIEKTVATIVTQTIVDLHDPAFKDPTKPIGPFYSEAVAKRHAEAKGFVVKEDAGRGWRRVVASPKPIDILEKTFITDCIDNGHIVIAAGGGGIPVVDRDGRYIGLEAVIDKDFAAEKLAELTHATTLLILTDTEAVAIHYRQADQSFLDAVKTDELQKYIDEQEFPAGSMLPKIEAAITFVKSQPDRQCIITSPDKAVEAIQGTAGTRITAS